MLAANDPPWVGGPSGKIETSTTDHYIGGVCEPQPLGLKRRQQPTDRHFRLRDKPLVFIKDTPAM
jgi:hypothetical protein